MSPLDGLVEDPSSQSSLFQSLSFKSFFFPIVLHSNRSFPLLRRSELVAVGCDGRGYCAGYQLLIVRGGELRNIRSLRSDFYGNCRAGQIIQRTQGRLQRANRNLTLLQFSGDG